MPIVAGLAVLTKFTRLGGYLVVAWLVLMATTLVVSGHRDLAICDLIMAVPAYTLGRSAALRQEGWSPSGRATPRSDAMPHVL